MNSPAFFDQILDCLRRDYSAAFGSIVVVDRTAADAKERTTAWLDGMPSDTRRDFLMRYSCGAETYVRDILAGDGAADKTADGAHRILCYNGGSEDGPIILLHECGHLIVPDAFSADLKGVPRFRRALMERRGEIAADAFAMLYSLKHGFLTPAGVMAHIANRMEKNGKLGGWFISHNTAPPLLNLLCRYKDADWNRIGAEDILKIAQSYAWAFTSGAETEKRLAPPPVRTFAPQ